MNKLALLTLPFALLASSAQAAGHLAVYGGSYDVLDDKSYAQFGAEYRFQDVYKGLRPTVGINSTDEGDVYGYGGINWDVPLGESGFYLTPNFMVGAYHHGDGKDLGGALEFRSGIEGSYEFTNGSRIGVAFNHISNASLYDQNPGAEALLVSYQHPMPW